MDDAISINRPGQSAPDFLPFFGIKATKTRYPLIHPVVGGRPACRPLQRPKADLSPSSEPPQTPPQTSPCVRSRRICLCQISLRPSFCLRFQQERERGSASSGRFRRGLCRGALRASFPSPLVRGALRFSGLALLDRRAPLRRVQAFFTRREGIAANVIGSNRLSSPRDLPNRRRQRVQVGMGVVERQ